MGSKPSYDAGLNIN